MRKFSFILLIITLLLACSKDEMDRTIFIPDETDGNLPAYTEWGYNSFGAEYEREYFLATNTIVPCKIVYKENKLQFSLSGRVRSDYYYGKEMSLIFIFPVAQACHNYDDLMQLDKMKIDLASYNCTVKMVQDGQETLLDGVKGELYFKRAQLLTIDDAVNRVILSGTFELRFLKNDFPTYISDGRFDLGITKNVFYAY
jgi:hypothetical protein